MIMMKIAIRQLWCVKCEALRDATIEVDEDTDETILCGTCESIVAVVTKV
jgi:hypothetical protein